MQDIHEMEKNCEGSLSCWVPLGKAMWSSNTQIEFVT
jgi:hypothetical protein